MCHSFGVGTQAAEILIITSGYIARHAQTGTNTIPATVYVGGALVLIGGIVNILAPAYVGKAGLNLRGIGFTWEIPNSKKYKEDF